MINKINMTDDVRSIIKTINEHGHEAFIVGGCVRDNCMGKPVHDWDITTSARPEEVKTYFLNTYDTGIKHGTVTVRLGKRNYEVTTYRIDGEYLDGRHPESVGFTDNINLDLQRRDFTMNAIAYNDDVGFIDPYGGMEDIRTGIIRAVGCPAERFDEDALRMVRALRFSAQLGFEIESDTYSTIISKQDQIKQVSVERIREELTKLLLSDNPCLDQLIECGMLKFLLIGGYLSAQSDELEHIAKCLSIVTPKTADRYSLLLSHAEPAKAIEIMSDLRFDNKTINDTGRMVDGIQKQIGDDFYGVRRSASDYVPLFESIIELKKAIAATSNNETEVSRLDSISEKYRIIKKHRDPLALKDLKINGNDILKLGIFKKGTHALGDLLNNLLDAVLKEPELNTKEQLTDLALRYTNMQKHVPAHAP